MADVNAASPVDLAHLARYTGGDPRINAEIFELFSLHCAETLRLLRAQLDAPERKSWHNAAHSLKGAAMGIGAFDLARTAGEAEAMNPEIAPVRAAALVRALGEHSELVQAFIEAYLVP
jgi:HPt (histidine-containing phosphotransfer) domain-containing protein